MQPAQCNKLAVCCVEVPPSGALTMMRGCDTPGGTSPCILTMWEVSSRLAGGLAMQNS